MGNIKRATKRFGQNMNKDDPLVLTLVATDSDEHRAEVDDYERMRSVLVTIKAAGYRIVKFTDELFDVETADGTILEEWEA